jgi:uncharacterized caspase-like protein
MKALLAAFVTLCMLWVLPAGAVEHRVALVIGNATYKGSPLANPVNDARAISSKLRSMGFEVIQRENLKARELGSGYREFRSRITPGGTALVFYAGHGLQFKGQNYFPAVDSDINSEDDVPLQSLNLGQLLDNMEEAKAGVSLVFLDACRDNPFARRFRSASRGLAKVEAASGTLIHYATRPGSVAADGDGQNGTYTEALLAQMSEPGVPVEMMLKKVSNNVVKKTSGKQEPWVEGSLRGDFYFIFQGPTTVNVQDSSDAETETWRVAESIGTTASYKSYLEAYPKGRYGVAAKMKLDALGTTSALSKSQFPASVRENPEITFWNEVKASGSWEYYDAYAKQYPKGKYLGLARLALKKLEDQAKADKVRAESDRKAEQARQDVEQEQTAEHKRQDLLRNEKDSWDAAKSADTVASYGNYLNSYPSGKFAALAQTAKQNKQRLETERALEEQQLAEHKGLGNQSVNHQNRNRVALVIGQSKYEDGNLQSSTNDANDMEVALVNSGFRVMKAIDGSQKAINQIIAQFQDELSPDSIALFYYSGLSLQSRGKNYLLPVDTVLRTNSEIRVETIDVDSILHVLKKTKQSVAIFDASRTNSITQRLGLSAGMAQMEASGNSLIAFSTAPGRTVADGSGRNSLFTQELLKQIGVPSLHIAQIFKNVRRSVAKATLDQQMPWESSGLTDEFYFLASRVN